MNSIYIKLKSIHRETIKQINNREEIEGEMGIKTEMWKQTTKLKIAHCYTGSCLLLKKDLILFEENRKKETGEWERDNCTIESVLNKKWWHSQKFELNKREIKEFEKFKFESKFLLTQRLE